MLELIALFHSKIDTRRFQKTREDSTPRQRTRGYQAPPAGRPAPRPTYQPPHCNIGSPPPPRLHLRCSLSRFDPRAHVGRSSLYISSPAPLLKASSHLRRQKPKSSLELHHILGHSQLGQVQRKASRLRLYSRSCQERGLVQSLYHSLFCISITFICQLQLL